MSLRIIVASQDARTKLVTLEGTLDSNSAPILSADIKKLREAGYWRFIVDMKGVDSAKVDGLRVLLALHKDVKNRGKLTLRAVPENILKVMRLSALDEVFSFENPAPAP